MVLVAPMSRTPREMAIMRVFPASWLFCPSLFCHSQNRDFKDDSGGLWDIAFITPLGLVLIVVEKKS